jgi:hypothetical protein
MKCNQVITSFDLTLYMSTCIFKTPCSLGTFQEQIVYVTGFNELITFILLYSVNFSLIKQLILVV